MDLAVAAVLFWASFVPGAEAALVTAAAATGRPPECLPPAAERQDDSTPGSVWARARVPGLERYCARLARGQARLASDPEAAGAAARSADEALPGRAAPLVLQARAALALGKLDDAVALFDRARAVEERSVVQPSALYDLATALRRTGRHRQALDVYRILVPRAAMLPTRAARALALLEAAHVSMTLGAQDDSTADLDEALAYLREAGRNRHHPFGTDVALSLALAPVSYTHLTLPTITE